MKRPELLQHGNIPRPLHGLAPRMFMPRIEWQELRLQILREHGNRCAACDRKREGFDLHLHEAYRMDYATGVMQVDEMVPLCGDHCHQFVHSGRLSVIGAAHELVQEIMDYCWLEVLKPAKAYISAATYTLIDHGMLPRPAKFITLTGAKRAKYSFGPDWDIKTYASWNAWRLVWRGQEHFSKFNNETEWADHYQRGERT